MAMGPFRVADLAGLDIGWAVRKHRAQMNPAPAVATLADRICEAGRLGQKTGSGWYRYEAGKREAIADPITDEIVSAFRKERSVVAQPVSDEEIVARCIYALVNEGARIVEDGIALRAGDVDIVWLNGYGFPSSRGGPMQYANDIGLPTVLAALQRFADVTGDAFWKPAPLLARLAAAGKPFA